MGFEAPQNRTEQAVERTAPFALLMTGLTVLWFAQNWQTAMAFLPEVSPWYPQRTCRSTKPGSHARALASANHISGGRPQRSMPVRRREEVQEVLPGQGRNELSHRWWTITGFSKKPGTPGKTTIPRDLVISVTDLLVAVFRKRGCETYHRLFVIPQQCFLYLEVDSRDPDDRGPVPAITKTSTTHTPLGRLRFEGDPNARVYERYNWKDDFWDEYNAEVGTPEKVMRSMIVEGLA